MKNENDGCTKNLDAILENRSGTHGDFESVSCVAQEIKDAMRDGCNWATDAMSVIHYEALDMIASKMARILCGNPNEQDHWLDIAGYAMLVANKLK